MKNPRNLLVALLGLALIGAGWYLRRERATEDDLRARLAAAVDLQRRNDDRHKAEQVELAKHTQQLEQQVRAMGPHLLELTKRIEAANARTRELETLTHDLEARLLAAQRAAAAANSTLTAAPAKSAPATIDSSGAGPNQAGAVRLQMQRRYGALIRRLGLTPGQSSQFMQLLVDKQLAGSDAAMAALQEGGGALNDPAAMATLVAASQDDIEAQIHALLGDSGYAQYLQTGLAIGQTSTLGRLQAALAGTEPLSDAQLAQLQQLIANSRVGHLTPQVVASAQAQGFLSPAQLQALQNLFLQQRAAQQRRNAPLPAAPAAGK